jgi:hypothetical protein
MLGFGGKSTPLINVDHGHIRSNSARSRHAFACAIPEPIWVGAKAVGKISRFKIGLFLLLVAAATLVAILLLPFELLRLWVSKAVLKKSSVPG